MVAVEDGIIHPFYPKQALLGLVCFERHYAFVHVLDAPPVGCSSTKTEETAEDPYKQKHDDEKDSRNNSEADQKLRHLNREQRLGRPAVFDSIVDQLLDHSVDGTLMSDCFELDGSPSKPVGEDLYALTTVDGAHSGWSLR